MKLNIIMHYDVDESTGEIKFIGKEEVTVDTVAKKSIIATKVDDSSEPTITLEPNKLVLTQSAVNLLEVCADCRIDIKYERSKGKSVPIIGTDSAFGTKSGNKLTKSNTVSYRGANNEKLSAYGTVFKLEPTKDKGIYYLIGDKVPSEEHKELVNIESELDMSDLDQLDIQEDNEELEKFDFSLL